MTDYDWWLRDHPGAINGPDYYEPFYEFSRRTNAEFRRDVCELVARYPSPVRLPIDSRIEGTIWAQVFTAFSESNVVPSTDVPKDILDGSIAPMFQNNRCQLFSGGYRQQIGYIIGGGIEAGYRALWHKDRFDISRDYSVDDHGMVRGMSLPTLAACTRKLNPQLNAAIDALVAEMKETKNSFARIAKKHIADDEKHAELLQYVKVAKIIPVRENVDGEGTMGSDKLASDEQAPPLSASWILKTDQIAVALVAASPNLASNKHKLAEMVHKKLVAKFKKTGETALAKRGGKTVPTVDSIKRRGLPSYGQYGKS